MTLLDYINSEERGFFLPDMGTNGLFITGYKSYDIYLDPNKQLELSKKMDEVFNADFVYSLSDGVIACEVLGLDVLKPDFDFPSVLSHPIKSVEDLKKFKIPDPYSTGRMPLSIKSVELIAKNTDKPVYFSVQGPFTLAVQVAGATHLLRNVIKDPEYIKNLLEFTTETVRRYAVAINKAGAKYISIAEPGAITLSPERFEELVVPNLNAIYKELDCWKGLHICGDTTEILDKMLMTDIDAISLDQIMNYKETMKRIPKDIVLIGNLDPLELLHRSNEDKIRLETIKLLKDMRGYNNYLPAFGCNCMNDTSIENLQTAINTAKISHEELDKIK